MFIKPKACRYISKTFKRINRRILYSKLKIMFTKNISGLSRAIFIIQILMLSEMKYSLKLNLNFGANY